MEVFQVWVEVAKGQKHLINTMLRLGTLDVRNHNIGVYQHSNKVFRPLWPLDIVCGSESTPSFLCDGLMYHPQQLQQCSSHFIIEFENWCFMC